MSAALLASDGRVICPRLAVADSAPTRMKGLLGRRGLEPGEGLLLRPAGSVHTAFMRFAIDVVFLNRQMEVLRVVSGMRPWRMVGQRGARAVLELAAGEAVRTGIAAGESLTLERTEDE